MDKARGGHREENLAKDFYFSDSYFSMAQLCSLGHQLNYIWTLKPSSAVEIGIGNGFVSTFLRRAGIPVTTIDINPELEPDICAPLAEACSYFEDKVDLVICCEVLEHIPLNELDYNLDLIRRIGDRLFLTLPNSKRIWGLGGILALPKIGQKVIDLNLEIPWRHPLGGPHFWEVGYNKDCSRRAIVSRLRKRYKKVRSGRFSLFPYHVYFICE